MRVRVKSELSRAGIRVRFVLGQSFKAQRRGATTPRGAGTLVASMAEYKFKIGETVYFHPKPPNDAPRGVYQIVRRLPAAEENFST
jgi:hypothetical protein